MKNRVRPWGQMFAAEAYAGAPTGTGQVRPLFGGVFFICRRKAAGPDLQRSALDGGEDAQFEDRRVAVEFHVCDVPLRELHPGGAGGGGGGVGDYGDAVKRTAKRGAG